MASADVLVEQQGNRYPDLADAQSLDRYPQLKAWDDGVDRSVAVPPRPPIAIVNEIAGIDVKLGDPTTSHPATWGQLRSPKEAPSATEAEAEAGVEEDDVELRVISEPAKNANASRAEDREAAPRAKMPRRASSPAALENAKPSEGGGGGPRRPPLARPLARQQSLQRRVTRSVSQYLRRNKDALVQPQKLPKATVAALMLYGGGGAILAFGCWIVPMSFIWARTNALDPETGEHVFNGWWSVVGSAFFYFVLVPVWMGLLTTALFGDRRDKPCAVAADTSAAAVSTIIVVPLTPSRTQWRAPRNPGWEMWSDKRFLIPYMLGAGASLACFAPPVYTAYDDASTATRMVIFDLLGIIAYNIGCAVGITWLCRQSRFCCV